jgi:hypothetical protein
MTLIEAAFYVQAQAAKVGATITGIHSISNLHDGTVACWFDTDVRDGIIICEIDQTDLMQLDGPHELLAFVRGDSDTRH